MKMVFYLLLAVCMISLIGCTGQPTVTTADTTENITEASTTAATQQTVVPDKLIALTFDDGPNNDLMPQFLDLLAQYNVKATFFVIGSRVPSYKAVVKRAYDEGHEIGNHSYSHIDLSTLPKDDIEAEVEKCQVEVELVTGERPAFFRPPFLRTSELMDEVIDLPYASGYSIDDGTEGTIADDRYYKTVTKAHDGAIMLLHCASHADETLEALERIIPELIAKGYEFVTVSELFERTGVTPETGVMYRSNEAPQK